MLKELKEQLLKAIDSLRGEKFAEATKLDAKNVSISERVVGGKVEMIGTDGTLSVAADGDYQVDNFIFSVKDGLIASIEGEAAPVDKTNVPTEDNKQDFEDVTTLAIGDEVTINPEAPEYFNWYAGVNFVVSSIDGYGDGMVGLTNAFGVYALCAKAESVTKTGNTVQLPKDDQQFSAIEKENKEIKTAIENLKFETAELNKSKVEFNSLLDILKKSIEGVATKEEVANFSEDVKSLNATIIKLAKIPSESPKTNTSNIVKEKNDDALMDAIKLLKSNKK